MSDKPIANGKVSLDEVVCQQQLKIDPFLIKATTEN